MRWPQKLKEIERWLPFAGIFAALWYVGRYRVDADFGWHYRSGEYIAHWGVPYHDIFSYTAANYPWVNHEWLNDWLVYWLYVSLGYYGLAIIFALIWTAALVMAARQRMSWAVAGVAVGALYPYVGVRPVAWTALLLTLTIRLVERRRWVYLPVVFAVWANLHGGFALGLVMVAIYAVAARSRPAVICLLVSVLATLANPYGWRVYHEIWQTLADAKLHSTIVEWAPLAVDRQVMPFVVMAIMTLLVYGKAPMWRRIFGALLVIATLSANRQLPLLVVGTVGLMEDAYEAVLQWLRANHLRERVWRVGFAVLGVGTGLVTLIWPLTVNSPGAQMPYRSVAELQAKPCAGQIFNHYSYGGYIIWRMPGTKVYIDGRMPSWSDNNGRYLDRWMRILSDPSYADSEFQKFDVKCALVTKTDKTLTKHLKATGWRLSVEESDAVLWRRD